MTKTIFIYHDIFLTLHLCVTVIGKVKIQSRKKILIKTSQFFWSICGIFFCFCLFLLNFIDQKKYFFLSIFQLSIRHIWIIGKIKIKLNKKNKFIKIKNIYHICFFSFFWNLIILHFNENCNFHSFINSVLISLLASNTFLFW